MERPNKLKHRGVTELTRTLITMDSTHPLFGDVIASQERSRLISRHQQQSHSARSRKQRNNRHHQEPHFDPIRHPGRCPQQDDRNRARRHLHQDRLVRSYPIPRQMRGPNAARPPEGRAARRYMTDQTHVFGSIRHSLTCVQSHWPVFVPVWFACSRSMAIYLSPPLQRNLAVCGSFDSDQACNRKSGQSDVAEIRADLQYR